MKPGEEKGVRALAAISRRRLLSASAGGAVGAALVGTPPAHAAAGTVSAPGAPGILSATDTVAPPSLECLTGPAAAAVDPTDPRYLYLAARGQNRRLTSSPQAVYEVFTPDQVPAAVTAAVRAGRRIAVRSGGHCLDGLVDNPSVTAVIDVSQMKSVYYDPTHNAFAVESGAMLGDVYKELYLGWGVVIPGGTCPTVGAGGYVAGGGFGALCRQYGMCVDHLYGVEVAVVDATGTARLVVATRDPYDPNRDLWWAHTGGGGGSFGVVTRYLFRSPGATGTDPAALLPRPPGSVLVTTASWPWSQLTQADFTTLVTNHGAWHAANSAPGSAYAGLFSALILEQSGAGQVVLICELDAALPGAADLMASYIQALSQGVAATHTVQQVTMPWLTAALAGLYGGSPGALNRVKSKGSYLRKPYSPDQIATLYKYLTNDAYTGLTALALFSYGGAVNAVHPGDTANPHRDSILLAYLAAFWSDPTQDDQHVAWIRGIYQDLYAVSGGVPASNAVTDGSYINYPDVDLADPLVNTSGIPWSTLYFGDNYRRLQQIKQRYDPADVFRHALSVRLP